MKPLISALLLTSIILSTPLYAAPDSITSTPTIQVALLLDTSNSMDGLIDQAKSRLWNIVNTLTTLKYNGKEPRIQIALYEYGNDDLARRDNWVQQVTPFTQDLDLISEKLFALNTNGGEEYTGAVIRDASKQLKWNDNRNSMKLIYIAGNESFNQGGVSYRTSITQARRQNITVNTIFCGDIREGVELQWKNGATIGDGKYFSINSNEKAVDIPTPYDDRLALLNNKLNDTYVGYGRFGVSKKANQAMQDSNAAKLAPSVMASRAITKSKSAAYKNSDWDLIDKAKDDTQYLAKANEAELPAELKGKNLAEKQNYIKAKSTERESLQKEISKLATQRQNFIDDARKANSKNSSGDDLGKAIEASVLVLAEKNGFKQVK